MRRLAQVTVLMLAAFAGSTLAQKPAAPDDIVTAFGLKDYRVTYKDEAGRKISAAKFNAEANNGKSLNIAKDDTRMTAVLSLAAKVSAPKEPSLAVKVGDAVPALSGTALDGKPLTLAANGERYTLLAFFFARCAPCLAEIPDLNHLEATMPGVHVVGVTFDPLATTRKLAAKQGIRYATLSDAKASIDALHLESYPTLMLIKPDGTLAATRHGGDLASSVESKTQLANWVKQAVASDAAKS